MGETPLLLVAPCNSKWSILKFNPWLLSERFLLLYVSLLSKVSRQLLHVRLLGQYSYHLYTNF